MALRSFFVPNTQIPEINRVCNQTPIEQNEWKRLISTETAFPERIHIRRRRPATVSFQKIWVFDREC